MRRIEEGLDDPSTHPLGTGVSWQRPDSPVLNGLSSDKSLRYRGGGTRETSLPREALFQNWTQELLEDGDKPIKEFCSSMKTKREIRKKQERTVAKKTGWESWKVDKQRHFRQFKSKTVGAFQYMEAWRRTLQTIGGQFGTGIQSYFSFLRFLILMNFVTFLLVGGFIVIPNIVFEKLNLGQSPISNSSGMINAECLDYNPNPRGLTMYYTLIMDILMGTGFMELTYMFYGFYMSGSVNLTAFFYNIPLAYLTTTLFYFLLSLVWTVIRFAQSFRQSMLTEDATASSYTNKVFAGWDFCLKDQKTIKLKKNSILYELKVDLEEDKMRQIHAQRTTSQRVGIYTVRVLVNLVVIGFIAGAFYCIYLSTINSQSLRKKDGVKGNFILELLVGYLPSIVITAANFILPTFFGLIIKLEKYTLSWEIRFTLIRCVFLRLASLGMLLYSLWDNITCGGNKEDDRCLKCGYNTENKCWETRLGQEMYKLMIFDFLTVLVVILLVDFPRKMMIDHCSCKLIQLWGQQEFLVPQYVLDIIYGQTVCWIGTFFCPMLPLLNTVKYFVIFYMKRLTLFTNCRPAERTFRASSANFFFLFVLLLGLALSWVPVLYSIFVIKPSAACGPFRGQQTIWDAITTTVKSFPEVAKDFFTFIGSQAFVVPLFCLSCILMFYLMALGNSYGKLVNSLKQQLQMERSRRIFLNQVNR
ncbi:transmembrane channel-like protein 4 [Spea bombifrons]|uniref:transmembrane channel-like protein 4 n=1 Tax=Spea bombifrons TaxID=233779 RepID=UPI00234B8D66|nr:transmembrane channel-like protein 4 [Spea bombifrons]